MQICTYIYIYVCAKKNVKKTTKIRNFIHEMCFVLTFHDIGD